MENIYTHKTPAQTEACHQKISDVFFKNDELKQSESDAQDINRLMAKMFGRFEEDNIQATVDHCFDIAKGKMESDHDKKVLAGLRQLVRQVEVNLYRPNPRFQDAFFFPNMANVKKMVNYIKMAKNTIDLSIFSFTNDDLANEIITAHKRGVKVRIITDDEAMKGKGADA